MTAPRPALDPELSRLLDELSELGASVQLGTPVTDDELAAAEASLGFALPPEYREFARTIGGLRVELERTWVFYGLKEALKKTQEYRAEFDSSRSSDARSWLPSRFLVLIDEGDFSNAASGTVYDADLEALRRTRGGRYIDPEDAWQGGYWGELLDALTDVRDRIADPDDPLVAGSDRERTRQKAKLGQHPEARADRLAGLAASVERLYEGFAGYPRRQYRRRCFPGCTICPKHEALLDQGPLRSLPWRALEHFAYVVVPKDVRGRSEAGTRTLREDFKHFLPRILELASEHGADGNAEVVLRGIHARTAALDLTGHERAAVDGYVEALWASLLVNPLAQAGGLMMHLGVFAHAGRAIGPFLAGWTRELGSEVPLRHAAALVAGHRFAKGPSAYGWTAQAEAFAELRRWLLGGELRAALARGGERDAFRLALDAIDLARTSG